MNPEQQIRSGFSMTELIPEEVVRKLQALNQKADQEAQVVDQISAQHDPVVGLGYTLTGGTANPLQQTASMMKKHNVPGQRVVASVAERRARSPQFAINQSLSQGKPVTRQQLNQTANEGIQMVGGVTRTISPNSYTIHPEDLDVMERFYQEVVGNKNIKGNLGQLGKDAAVVADHYLGKGWATSSNKKLAEGFARAIDMARRVKAKP